MAKETATARKSRISMLLAHYDAASRELHKLAKEVDGLKEQIKTDVPAGTYGDWVRAEGTPREILDQAEAKNMLTRAGLAVPTKMTDAPVIVTPVAKPVAKGGK